MKNKKNLSIRGESIRLAGISSWHGLTAKNLLLKCISLLIGENLFSFKISLNSTTDSLRSSTFNGLDSSVTAICNGINPSFAYSNKRLFTSTIIAVAKDSKPANVQASICEIGGRTSLFLFNLLERYGGIFSRITSADASLIIVGEENPKDSNAF